MHDATRCWDQEQRVQNIALTGMHIADRGSGIRKSNSNTCVERGGALLLHVYVRCGNS